jgi:ABC-type transport system involved in cytochrome bd biosynthesis fused ATPase/permease subunit
MSPIDKDLISLVLLELLALVIIPYLSIRLKKSLKKRVEQRNKQLSEAVEYKDGAPAWFVDKLTDSSKTAYTPELASCAECQREFKKSDLRPNSSGFICINCLSDDF